MIKTPEDPFENLRKAMLAMQAISKPIIEMQSRLDKAMKPLVTLTSAIQKYLEPFQKMGELFTKYIKQIRQNFVDAISIIDTPENYVPTKITLHDGIHQMALNMVVFVEDMDRHPFCYLKERMLIGINAHLEGNYHLSLFAIFSAIDGMLTWFYVQNHPGFPIPHIDKKLKEFFETYNFEHVIGKQEIRPKFENFFKHRNEIMHGGEHSHFDKNLSTTALLFLGIVYYSLTENKK